MRPFCGRISSHRLPPITPRLKWDGSHLPNGGIYHGLEGITEHMARLFEAFENWEIEYERYLDPGDERVLVFTREKARTKLGVEVNEAHAELYTVRGGKIVRWQGFRDREAALEAVGLSE
jgi:ketosteroid isomerase-like protein